MENAVYSSGVANIPACPAYRRCRRAVPCSHVRFTQLPNASAFVSLFQIVRPDLEKKKSLSEKILASSRLGGSTVLPLKDAALIMVVQLIL